MGGIWFYNWYNDTDSQVDQWENHLTLLPAEKALEWEDGCFDKLGSDMVLCDQLNKGSLN